MIIMMRATVEHNRAQNSYHNLPSFPPDNHQASLVCWTAAGVHASNWTVCHWQTCSYHSWQTTNNEQENAALQQSHAVLNKEHKQSSAVKFHDRQFVLQK